MEKNILRMMMVSMHIGIVDYGRDLAKFLGYEIKEMEEIDDEYNI